MKNLEVRLAYVLGVALPLLETGMSNWIVVAIKGVIFALAIVCFALAIRSAAGRRPAPA